MSSATRRICATRAVKNIKYLENLLPANEINMRKGLTDLSPEVLLRIHTLDKPQEVLRNNELANFLEKNRIPLPKATISHHLFNGSLVFVQLVFNRAGQPPFSISNADLLTAINYSNSAVVPIHKYASQYGHNTILVSPNILSFTVTLTGNTFSDADLQGWIKTIAQNSNLNNSCIMVLIDVTGPRNSDGSGNIGGYHYITDNKIPYCFCNVFGQNLTVDDNQGVYAEILSHEIAEMVVDPAADLSNPEVCDACAGNCGNVWNEFFDSNNKYIDGSKSVPPSFSYTYFINSLIRPESYDPTTECAKMGSDPQAVCVYAPPLVWGGPDELDTVSNIAAMAAEYNVDNHRHNIFVGRTDGKVNSIYFKDDTVGIEGNDVLPGVQFSTNSIAAMAAEYNTDNHRHNIFVGRTDGKVNSIYFKDDTVGIEGNDELLAVQFVPHTIVAMAAEYNTDNHRHNVFVGTSDGRVYSLWLDGEEF